MPALTLMSEQRKRAGSFSASSQESQATGLAIVAASSARSVVLPEPAGAETSVPAPGARAGEDALHAAPAGAEK